MAERVVDEVLVKPPLPEDWRAAVETIARRSHEVFIARPWLPAISPTRRDLGHNALRHAEQLLTAIAPLNLPAADAWKVLFLINDYTLGHALRIAHAPEGPSGTYPLFRAGQFPRLAAPADQAPARGEDTFTAGLRVLLDAVEKLAPESR